MQTTETFRRVRGPWPGVPETRRRIMRANKPTDTTPELRVRKMLHGRGYRYRLHCESLPGRPDIVFPGRRAAIQIHGCFWHQHGCSRARLPKSRLEYWAPKFARNVERDRENETRLRQMEWRVLVLWECELSDLESVAQRIGQFLGPTRK